MIPNDLNSGFTLTIPIEEVNFSSKAGATSNAEIAEGNLVSGPLRSVKNNCLFVQIGGGKVPVIGRLHRVETFNSTEFESLKVGDII